MDRYSKTLLRKGAAPVKKAAPRAATTTADEEALLLKAPAPANSAAPRKTSGKDR